MSEVNQAGYTELRGYIEENWDLVLYEPGGDAALTLDPSDPRVNADDTHPNIVYTVELSGDDADITPPLTLAGGRLQSGATVVAPDEDFAEGDGTIGGTDDEITVTATFTMPGAA